MVKKYDHIVVGGGVSGLTLATLLGLNGRRVLLLERGKNIGGSLARFYKEGVPFDTGFHFTGGFSSGGILTDMLQVLGFTNCIKPIFFTDPGSVVFRFEENGGVYDIPPGIENFRLALHKYFPEEISAIDGYFNRVKKVCDATVTLDLHKIALSAQPIEEDFVTLEKVLNTLTTNLNLKGVLAAVCLCYGTSPKEVSFANHARVAAGLYDSMARIENGGEALIRAFREAFIKSKVEIICNTTIVKCDDIKNDRVGKFILDNGEIVSADDCIFTIHPQEVLKILPREHLKKAFVERVSAFESSNGFFSVFGIVENADPKTFGPSMTSFLPTSDINALLDPNYHGRGALVVVRSVEKSGGKTYCVINAFEPDFFVRMKQWADSTVGQRPAAYYEYKEDKTKEIRERICGLNAGYQNNFKILGAASVLTFRDYLFSPEGNAYGIKQKIGQFNLFGKQSLLNIYVAGQSGVLPGLVGAMLSSFIIARSLLGKEEFTGFIEKRLCH